MYTKDEYVSCETKPRIIETINTLMSEMGW